MIKFRDTLSDQEPGDDVIPVEGCEFEVRLKSTGELFCTLVTDEYGYATTADRENYPYGRLPFGTYTLTETKWPEDLNPVKPFDVTIEIDRKVYRGIYKNDQPIEMPITFVKADAESGLTIPIPGTEFQILDGDKNVITFTNHYPHEEKITNFITDASGTITLPEKLPYGTYYAREVNAPFGYLRGEDLEFQVTESGTWAEPMTITYQDRPAKGKVKVAKYDADTKELIFGAVFTVFAAEDIITGDGITHYAEGTYVDTFVIGEDGVGYSKELYLGKYYLQEAKAPEGYCLDTDRHYFELKYEDQDTEVAIGEMELLNKPTTLKIYKTDEDGGPLDGVSFELKRIGAPEGSDSQETDDAKADGMEADAPNTDEAKVDDEKADGPKTNEVTMDNMKAEEEQEENTIAAHDEDGGNGEEDADASDSAAKGEGIYVSSDGGLIVEKYLASGVYSLTETATLPGYVLDKNPRYVTVDKNGFIYESDMAGNNLDVDKAKSDTVTLEWRNDYTKWDFSKVDAAGQEIEGAEMEIQNKDGEILYSWISDGAPHRIERIPAGVYILVEKTAPEGYVLAEKMEFEVTDTGIVQKAEMVDKRVLVSKKRITGSEELPGAVLTVFDSDGNVVDTWMSSDAPHPVSGLKLGHTYTLREETAPDGYAKAEDVLFTALDDYEDQLVEMRDELLLIDISKTDISTGKELPGAKLTVRDKAGEVVEEWISGEEPHRMNLPAGEYTLTETMAPEKYATAESVTFVVEETAGVQKVEMKDAPIQVSISKRDITTDQELPGAKLTVTDKDGAVVEEWVSGEEPHMMNLPVGTYTLTETAAPEKYATAESVTFEVKDTAETQKVEMKDAPIQVSISKQDITTGQELPGARLTVTGKDDEVIDEWISGSEPHMMNLPVGTYTLTETAPPEKYVTAERITFEVKDTAETQKVEMKDAPIQVSISKQDATTGKELPGAKLTVTDSSGNVVEEWISAEEPRVMSLPVGNYTLTEVTAPEKYATAESVPFTVRETAEIQKVEMKDAPIQVSISKQDITTGEELPGAKLTVTDKDGNLVEEWISAEEPRMMNLPAGTYTLTETAAPEKYATAESVTFEVRDTAEIQKVEMKDAPIQVSVSKQDVTTGKELPGAKLTVTDKDGNLVEEWISSEEPHRMSLAVGVYILNEITAPDKYATAESVEFEVKDTAEIQKVEMKDAPIQVSISKKDITNDEELPGAKLTIKDSEGNTVEEWISSDEPHQVNLSVGKYTLTEVTAPNGYEVAETISFEVTDSMEVQHVTMYDSPKEKTVDLTGKKDTKTTTQGGTSVSSPAGVSGGGSASNVTAAPVQTGDAFRYLPAILLIGLGVALLAAFGIRKVKRKKSGKKE